MVRGVEEGTTWDASHFRETLQEASITSVILENRICSRASNIECPDGKIVQ